ncbi:hypothetical protein Nepgr_006489 [Nepenthes gracilis]|uniref:Uncharacterized protein n=1 Tax=Nepenthes gracilis TaxID=150966 RepID=A0AAD3XHE4_NEPGR|nr:hypothetical protein Nepgr_006489 [Nepenthes gracilis]
MVSFSEDFHFLSASSGTSTFPDIGTINGKFNCDYLVPVKLGALMFSAESTLSSGRTATLFHPGCIRTLTTGFIEAYAPILIILTHFLCHWLRYVFWREGPYFDQAYQKAGFRDEERYNREMKEYKEKLKQRQEDCRESRADYCELFSFCYYHRS